MTDKTTGAPGELNGVTITWDDSEMASAYANIGTATANREEFFFLLAHTRIGVAHPVKTTPLR